jgi:hypothetical protein
MQGRGKRATVMQVFVHLAYGFDAVEYERKWAAGRKGMNDRHPPLSIQEIFPKAALENIFACLCG